MPLDPKSLGWEPQTKQIYPRRKLLEVVVRQEEVFLVHIPFRPSRPPIPPIPRPLLRPLVINPGTPPPPPAPTPPPILHLCGFEQTTFDLRYRQLKSKAPT